MAGQVVRVWCGWLCAVLYAVSEVSVWFCLSDIDQGQTCQVGQVAGECTDVSREDVRTALDSIQRLFGDMELTLGDFC